MRIEENALRLTRLDGAIVHKPIRNISIGQESMDILGNALLLAAVELMGVESKCSMAHGLKPHVLMCGVDLRLGWCQNPFMEDLIQVFYIGSMVQAVFEFHSVCPTAILGLQMGIAKKKSNENISLQRGQLQGGLPEFKFAGTHCFELTEFSRDVRRLYIAIKIRLYHSRLVRRVGIRRLVVEGSAGSGLPC